MSRITRFTTTHDDLKWAYQAGLFNFNTPGELPVEMPTPDTVLARLKKGTLPAGLPSLEAAQDYLKREYYYDLLNPNAPRPPKNYNTNENLGWEPSGPSMSDSEEDNKGGNTRSCIGPKPVGTAFRLRQLVPDPSQAPSELSGKSADQFSSLEQQFSALTFTPIIPPAPRMPDWVVTVGTTHFCNDRSLFATYEPLHGISLLRGNICGIGTVKLQLQIPQNIRYPEERNEKDGNGERELVLREVLHIPDYIYNGFQFEKAFPFGRTEILETGNSGGRGFDKKEGGREQWYSEPWRGASRLLLVGDEVKDPKWDLQERYKEPNEEMSLVFRGVKLESLALEEIMRQVGWLNGGMWKKIRYSRVKKEEVGEDEDLILRRGTKRRASGEQTSRPKGFAALLSRPDDDTTAGDIHTLHR